MAKVIPDNRSLSPPERKFLNFINQDPKTKDWIVFPALPLYEYSNKYHGTDIDFLILALNQMINHVDKIRFMSENKMCPRIIIRTSIGPKKPLDGGPQHTADYTEALRKMVTEIKIISLVEPEDIFPAFKSALESEEPECTLLVENGAYYNDK